MPHPLDRERFGALLHDTARAWRLRLDQRLKPLGMSQSQWMVLLWLSRGCNGMSQKALAERLGIEGPAVVGLLDRLARNGWIERRVSAEDRRSKTVHMTPKAEKTLLQIQTVAAQLRSELLEAISDEKLQHCIEVLEAIGDKADNIK